MNQQGSAGQQILGLDGGNSNSANPPPEAHALAQVAPPPAMFSGHVYEAFTGASKSVAAATVQILGTQLTAETDDSGSFSFPGISVAGVLPIVVTRDGYLKRRIDLHPSLPADIELVSESALAVTAVALGEPRAINNAYLYGQIVNPSGTSDGLTVEILGAGNARVIYVDVNGAPDSALKSTTTRGQFLVLDLVPGTYLVTITNSLGHELAPHLIYVGDHEGVVRKFSAGTETFISGHVTNAAAYSSPVGGAQVQLLGSSKTVVTAPDGSFTLGPVHVDCASQNYVHVEKSGYYRNRVDYACGPDGTDHKLYAFPSSYVDGVAADAGVQLVPAAGAVIGHVSFKVPVRMQLWGPEEMRPESAPRGSDFYFDNDGVINADLDHTKKSGNFSILNTPDGISYIQAFDAKGRTLSYWPIYTSASTVNSYAQ